VRECERKRRERRVHAGENPSSQSDTPSDIISDPEQAKEHKQQLGDNPGSARLADEVQQLPRSVARLDCREREREWSYIGEEEEEEVPDV
jgi:hypothetical protein